MSRTDSILICQCAERGLVDVGGVATDAAVVVADLCEAARDGDPVLSQTFAEIHACHPRAVKALFDFAGNPLPEEVEVVNHRIPTAREANDSTTESKPPAWFPVIDYDRCTNCGQCHEFCLFGVYSKASDGKIVVTNPASCKNNCPACARICPETAIIFPKVGETPIDGAEITDEIERAANVKINVDEILGDDVYATLNARKNKRRSLLNRKKIDQALAERKKFSEGEA